MVEGETLADERPKGDTTSFTTVPFAELMHETSHG